MQRDIFRKTEAGQAELRSRERRLDARSRTLLILANGQRSVAELARHLGFDPLTLLPALLDGGFVERVVPVSVASSAAPSPAVPAAAAVSPRPPPDLHAAKIRALDVLAPHYGPDTLRMADPLLSAATPQDFAAALDTLQATLSVHMGQRRAAAIARQIAARG